MPCVISSPSTDSGKTTLSLLISWWANSKGIKVQTFKVGPDYLDQQQLSSIGQPICRNLDIFSPLILSNSIFVDSVSVSTLRKDQPSLSLIHEIKNKA